MSVLGAGQAIAESPSAASAAALAEGNDYRFCLPAVVPIATYPVRVVGEEIQVGPL